MYLIILWMILFSLIHSIMADKRTKAWVANTFGERVRHGWYRLFYNLVSAISLAPLLLYMATNATRLYAVPGWLAPVFLAIQLVGLIGAGMSLLQIDWMRFAGLRQVFAYINDRPLPLASEALKTDGMYRLVRHPLYFFSLLIIWFSPVMTTTGLLFNIMVTLYFVIGSIVEERRMLDYYGDDYARYRREVSWLIPFLPPQA